MSVTLRPSEGPLLVGGYTIHISKMVLSIVKFGGFLVGVELGYVFGGSWGLFPQSIPR